MHLSGSHDHFPQKSQDTDQLMTAGGGDSAGGSGGGLLYTACWRFPAPVHYSCSAGSLLPLLQMHCTLSTTRGRNLSLGAIPNKGNVV